MPRINDQLLECVFYLYPTRKAAEDGAHMGGTGFITGIRSTVDSGTFYGYAVTNQHVAIGTGSSVIRLNKRDGTVDIRELDPAEWIPDPTGNDLAIIPLGGVAHDIHAARLFDDSLFLTEASSRELDVGPGDDVFMVGRFINHDGKERNEPSVRFGNVSMQPRVIMQDKSRNYFPQVSYGVEMRSMGGYSGSPVFMYRGPWDMKTRGLKVSNSPTLYFLGVNWGHITDKWEVEQGMSATAQQSPSVPRKIDYVRANTGMNGVIPAWLVKRLLDLPALVNHRNQQEALRAAQLAGSRGGVALDAGITQ